MDELESLREQLEEARAETARLSERLADREARAAELEQRTAALHRDLETAHAERRAAVTRYRDTLLTATPELPAALVAGDTLEAVDQAVQTAREVVARVREHVAVPAGSPPRRGTDVAGLSPGEKIRYGLAER